MFNIDFNQETAQFFYHPRYKDIAGQIFGDLHFLKKHFILFSSGTTSISPKGYAVSTEALLANAQAVNSFFNLTSNDIWGLSLPYYHIGGLSVIARSYLLGSKLVELNDGWDPYEWTKKVDTEGVSITTVVPTQVYDLVKNRIPAPAKLRLIIVGGDFLSSKLFEEASALGWPIIKTFGMTEVCSQLASSSPENPKDLTLLPLHQVKVDQEERLWVKSPAMYTLEFLFKDEQTHMIEAQSRLDADGFFPTSDRAVLENNIFIHQGRLDDQIKINGRLTSLHSLKEILYNYALNHQLFGHLELKLTEDERSGKVIEILSDLPINQDEIISLLAPARLRFRTVEKLARTDLGKFKG